MRLANRRIHIVGDDAQHNVAVEGLLSQHDATLQVHSWSMDATTRLDPTSVADIILLDPLLPCKAVRIDIFLAMFHELRSVSALTKVPIVAMSLADPITLIPFLREIGFRGFLRKPLNYAHFANQIADIVDGKQVWEYR